MVQSLRFTRRCSYCQQDIDPQPMTAVPMDLGTGKPSAEMCLRLGICPFCLTQTIGEFSTRALNRIKHRLWVLSKQKEGK